MEKKSLLVLEINECDFDFFNKGAKKYKYPLIVDFFKNKKINFTYTRDKNEGLNLDPWVQWVSVHTGRKSKKHGVLRLGQKLSSKIPQLWDILPKKKKILWGLFNSILKSKKNINIFFPDPWSYTQHSYPGHFDAYLKLPRYYAKNYPDIKFFYILKNTLIFFLKIIFSKNIFYVLRNIHMFIYLFFKYGVKSFNLYFFLDLLSLEIVDSQLNKKKTDLAIIGLNSFAHYQHNYWDKNKFEPVYFWYLNQMIKKFTSISSKFNSKIIYNGFSQKKIKPQFALRPKKFNEFFKILQIEFYKIEPNMTTGVTIFFKSHKDKKKAIKNISEVYYNNYKLFYYIDYKNVRKIFLKFNIVFMSDNIEKILNKKTQIKVFNKNRKKIKEKKDLLKIIFNNCIFLKSTSEHKTSGKMYTENFFNNHQNLKIENHKMFDYIIKYFKD
jgi:hypothetical protein